MDITVSNDEELVAAMETLIAEGGGRIFLKSGVYKAPKYQPAAHDITIIGESHSEG